MIVKRIIVYLFLLTVAFYSDADEAYQILIEHRPFGLVF